MVGQGKVKPVKAKIKAVTQFLREEQNYKKELMRFLGMAGYYRKFCQNFSAVTELNYWTRENFVWCDLCEKALQELKVLLNSTPVIAAPDFNAPFKLAVDASDVAASGPLFKGR